LPPRVKEAVTLGKIEGLSRGEIALRMGVSEGAVAQYLVRGIRALVDILYGETSKPRRPQ
jgi:DNA-directed RNA polymerase specialized sigma24 family protein